jgi:hypothetical protein
MDGILSGLTSIIPILPDQTTIADRSGLNLPPVEIMPVPSDSFMSDDATAELLNNPFTLSLDKDKYGSGAAPGSQTSGRSAHQAGRAVPDDIGVKLNEAYTLSLGNEESTPIAAEIEREMSRMQNYEMLGKTAARHIYRKNPETGTTEQPPIPHQDGGPEAPLGEKVKNLLSQPTTEYDELLTRLAPQNGETVTRAQTPDVFLTQPEMQMPDDSINPEQAARPALELPPTVVRQNLTLLSSLTGLQLSASDIDAILTLEPELQEALLNMLGDISNGSSDRSKYMPEALLVGAGGEKTAPAASTPGKNNSKIPVANLLIQSQPEAAPQAPGDILRQRDTALIQQMADVPSGARAAFQTEEEMVRLAADTLNAGRAALASPADVLRGDMANLQKITELPFSLYLFGNVNAGRKEDADEEIEIDLTEEPDSARIKKGDFLRLSEAVKMAAVLHNIYYGGTGRFREETPWYMPYVRYAVKNGIITSKEFGDYNGYATRAETAYIFSNCVPKAEFPILNYITNIPDVVESIGYGGAIYLLFRAGILKKSGRNANFSPESMITKTEAAGIIGRIATPEDRKRVLNSVNDAYEV